MYYFENDLLEHFPRNISLESHYPLTKRQKQLLPTQEEFSSPSQIDFTFHIKSIHKNVSSGVRRNGQRYPPFRSKI